MSDEVCFPRGELRAKRKQKEEKKPRRKKRKIKKSEDVDLTKDIDSVEYTEDMIDQLDKLERAQAKLNVIPYLTLKTVKEGCVLLGCVTAVLDDELAVGLPFLLRGRITIEHICGLLTESYAMNFPQLSELFTVGQLVVCSVLGVDESVVELTLDPKVVNTKYNSSNLTPGMQVCGFVRSVEDHGYIVDVGKENVNAFIPAANPDQQASKLKKFQFIRCVVTEVKCDGRVLLLSCQQKLLNKAAQKSEEMDYFHPGTLVKFLPELSTSEGKFGKVSLHDACVSMLHLSNAEQSGGQGKSDANENMQKKHKGSSELLLKDFLLSKPAQGFIEDKSGFKIACVLYTSSDGVLVLSANSCMWKPNQRSTAVNNYKEKFPRGQKYTAKLLERIPNFGCVCQLHKTGVIGFVDADNLSDDISELNADSVEKIKVRITENNSLDGVIELSAKKSVYDAVYLTYNDVCGGEIVLAQILEISAGAGLKMALGSWKDKKFLTCDLQAIVPPLHMSDITLKRPEKLFQVGDVLSCRVLHVNIESQLVVLTHKKTLVQSKLPIVTDYQQLVVDDVIHVYIKAIKHQGCIVGLYNSIKGFVPREELALPNDDTPIFEEFHLGQVVRARVCGCDPYEEKLIMSFNVKKNKRKLDGSAA